MAIPTGEVDQLNELGDAISGSRGGEQQRIARVGLEWICLLFAKNADYGASVWQSPVLCPGMEVTAAIRVRMSDKIARLAALQAKGAEVDESLEDTIRDLGAYCLLYLTRPTGDELHTARK